MKPSAKLKPSAATPLDKKIEQAAKEAPQDKFTESNGEESFWFSAAKAFAAPAIAGAAVGVGAGLLTGVGAGALALAIAPGTAAAGAVVGGIVAEKTGMGGEYGAIGGGIVGGMLGGAFGIANIVGAAAISSPLLAVSLGAAGAAAGIMYSVNNSLGS